MTAAILKIYGLRPGDVIPHKFSISNERHPRFQAVYRNQRNGLLGICMCNVSIFLSENEKTVVCVKGDELDISGRLITRQISEQELLLEFGVPDNCSEQVTTTFPAFLRKSMVYERYQLHAVCEESDLFHPKSVVTEYVLGQEPVDCNWKKTDLKFEATRNMVIGKSWSRQSSPTVFVNKREEGLSEVRPEPTY